MRFLLIFLVIDFSINFFIEANNKAIAKLYNYFDKNKIEKAQNLLEKELIYYSQNSENEINIYNFIYYSDDILVDPDLCFMAYSIIALDTINSFEKLDVMHWYINKCLEYIKSEYFMDSEYISDDAIKIANRLIDSIAYDLLEINYTFENINHFYSLYIHNYSLPEKLKKIEYDYYFLSLSEDIKACNKDLKCIKSISIYYQGVYKNKKFISEIQNNLDSLEYFSEEIQNNVSNLTKFILNHPKNRFILQAKHLLFTKYFANRNINNRTLHHFIRKYHKCFCSHKKCINNPYLWMDFNTSNIHTYKKDEHIFQDLVLLHASPMLNQDLILIQDEQTKKYGFKNIEDQIVIYPKYNRIDPHYLLNIIKNDFLKVYVDNKLEVINKNKKIIIHREEDFDKVENFNEVVLLTNKNGLYGLYNKNGFEILKPKYEEILPFSANLVKVKKNGKWGIINYLNRVFIPLKYQSIKEINHLILAKTQKAYEVFQYTDTIDLAYKKLGKIRDYTYEDDYLKIKKLSSKYSLIDKNGKFLIEDVDKIKSFNNSWAVENNNKYMIYSFHNQKLYKITTKMKNLKDMKTNNYYFAIKTDKLWGVNNTKGDVIIYPSYTDIFFIEKSMLLKTEEGEELYYHDGILTSIGRYKGFEPVYMKNKQIYVITTDNKDKKSLMNIRNEEILLKDYEDINLLDNGIAIISKNNQVNCIHVSDPTNLLLEESYQDIVVREDGLFNTFKNSKFGLFDPISKWLIPSEYESILKFYDKGIYIAKKDNLLGLISQDNVLISEFAFKNIIRCDNKKAIVQLLSDKFNIYDIKNKMMSSIIYDSIKYIENKNITIFLEENSMGVLNNLGDVILKEKDSRLVKLGDDSNLLLSIKSEENGYTLNWNNTKGKAISSLKIDFQQYNTLENILKDRIYKF